MRFLKALPLGHLAGCQLFAHPFVLLVPALLLWLAWQEAHLQSLVRAAVLMGLLALALALHEVAHALTARAWGVHRGKLLLTPLGGWHTPETPPGSGVLSVIALSGPLANLVVAGLLWPLAGPLPAQGYLLFEHLQLTPASLLSALCHLNLALAVLNLLPIVPMDAARLLRLALAPALGELAAARFVAILGKALAALGTLWVLLRHHDALLTLTLLLLYLGAAQDYTQARTQARGRL